MGDTHDYHDWNTMSEKEYLKKAHKCIDNSQSYSLEEAEMIQSAKKIAKIVSPIINLAIQNE